MEARDYQPLPCGKCPECKKRTALGWAFRLMEEEKRFDSSLFITLTYATENVPISSGLRMSLAKRDVVLFFKRLRKAHSKSGVVRAIKYFAVGEYGGVTHRPHYHVLLFGADIEKIQEPWGLGSIYYGSVSGASVAYTLKYMMKSIPKSKDKWKREKEFRLMSKGLGKSYVDNKKFQKWHKADVENRMYLNLTDGKKIGMPRYYKDRMYDPYERELCAFAGLKKVRSMVEQDTRTLEERRQAVLVSYFKMEFEQRARCTV